MDAIVLVGLANFRVDALTKRQKLESGKEKRDFSHPQADAFAGAKAEDEIGLLRSK
jgi:hypothetical protein